MAKTEFKVGQLVRSVWTNDIGRVVEVDPDYFGARQAFKVFGAERGQAIGPGSENGIGPTKHGIRDRVKVLWYTNYEATNTTIESMDGKDIIALEDENEV